MATVQQIATRSGAPRARLVGQQGFTMIEVLITLAVTLIGLAGLMTLHHVVTDGTGSAARMAEASGIAESALEEVRQLAFTRIESQFGAPPIDVELEQAAGKGERVYDRRLLVEPLDEVSADLFRVRIEVSWTDDGAAAGSDDGSHDHTFVLETFRTRQEAM
jgi:prepilin-type N-terminal cleavage/methylation domain-containing protein